MNVNIDDAQLTKLSADLAIYYAKKSGAYIFDKVKVAKEKTDKNQTIANLEDIIDELIEDKKAVIEVAKKLEDELVAQKISDEDIEFISEKIVPLLGILVDGNDDEQERRKMEQVIQLMTPLLSKETFNIMQLLGFNFKQAIGQPLTTLVRGMILSKLPPQLDIDKERDIVIHEKDKEFFRIIQDESAFERYQTLIEKNQNN